MIRTLLIDDEPLARRRLRSLLSAAPDFQIEGEAEGGEEAIRMVEELRPDVIFLDVQMPGMTGFDVLERLGDEAPLTVFITAFEEFALRAFQLHAVSYLTKPIEASDMSAVLERVRRLAASNELEQERKSISRVVEEMNTPRAPLQRIVVRDRGRTILLRLDEIDWIEAAGNYVRLHVGKDKHLVRETMNAIEQKLDPNVFLRVHRSTIVNLERIRELLPASHGDYEVVLRDGTHLTLSRVYRERVEPLIGRL